MTGLIKVKLEKATRVDAGQLTELTLRSKAYWGYSAEQIKVWEPELTITEDYISSNHVFKLTEQRQLIGYYSFFAMGDSVVKLDNLFVEAVLIGKGYGKALLTDFVRRVKGAGIEKVLLEADPQAAGFYRKHGFIVVGELESTVQDRYLPVMELKL